MQAENFCMEEKHGQTMIHLQLLGRNADWVKSNIDRIRDGALLCWQTCLSWEAAKNFWAS